MTANVFTDDAKRSIESGMNAHIAKPLDIKALVKNLQKVLKSKNAKANDLTEDKNEKR